MGRGGSTDKLKRLFPALLMLACSPALRAQSTPQEPYAFLRKFAHFTERAIFPPWSGAML